MTTVSNPPVPASAGTPGTTDSRHVRVAVERDAEGNPKFFTLRLADQAVTLNPGKTWLKVDEYKWATRGLIEAPQSFHIEPNGTVDVNGERVALDDPDGVAKLEHELNKHRVGAVPKKPATPRAAPAALAGSDSRTPHFKVKLDQFGHLVVECTRGAERIETGLRGLPSLVQNGLLLAPKHYHVDPLHRGVEMDGTFFEATAVGAQRLAEVLNAQYAPSLEDEKDTAIEIRENPAAATGFDIHFVTVVSGARFEVKGHLSQEKLELLQDPAKCDLLQPGVLLRLTPPNLLFRRRRSDGGEDRIPELPDVQYRRVTAPELQHLFNHPLIRRGGGSASATALHPTTTPADPVELRVVRNPLNKSLLWLETHTTAGGAPEGRAFTHHNLADLQQAGVFLPHLDVSLSLDHRTLGVLDKATGHENKLTLDSQSLDSVLAEAGHMLTAALKPPRTLAPPLAPAPAAAVPAPPVSALASEVQPPLPAPLAPASPLREERADPPEESPRVPAATLVAPPGPPVPVLSPSSIPAVESDPGVDPAVLAWFDTADPLAVIVAVFDRLATRLGMPVQDILLTLPRAFEDRRFQVLSFSHPEIETILDLRSEAFYGFYLSHVSRERVLLVYACKGRHIEWGPDRCLWQSAVSAEPTEFRHSALLGLAQDAESNFVFIVSPAYRDWAKGFERLYLEVCARAVTPRDIALAPDRFLLIWPEAKAGGKGTVDA